MKNMITKNRIAQIKSLSQKKARVELKQFVAEGIKMFEQIINSNFSIVEIYYLSDVENELFNMIGKMEVETFKITSNDMSRISQLKTPTSVLIVVEIPNPTSKGYVDGLSLALDSVQDPGNLGTIIRIADWFGISKIFCSMDCADIYSPKVIQATMGAITRIKVEYLDLESFLSKVTVPVYGTFLEGENIYTQKLVNNSIIVMGNEGNGISNQVAKLVTNKINIPSFPVGESLGESLNVAVATAICVSEFRRC